MLRFSRRLIGSQMTVGWFEEWGEVSLEQRGVVLVQGHKRAAQADAPRPGVGKGVQVGDERAQLHAGTQRRHSSDIECTTRGKRRSPNTMGSGRSVTVVLTVASAIKRPWSRVGLPKQPRVV